MESMIIVVDIGSQKVRIGAFDAQGKLTNSIKVTTPSDASDAIDLISSAIAGHFNLLDLERIIVGISGAISSNGQRVEFCSNLDESWQNLNLVRAFRDIFDVPVTLENDAILAGAYEVSLLGKSIPSKVVYIGIGGGIGTSLLINGKIDPLLANSMAGTMPLEFDSIVHPWEDFASAQAINEIYNQLLSEIKSARTWEDIADRLARGVQVIIPTLQPQMIIIGGLMGLHLSRYQVELEAVLHQNLNPYIDLPQIVAARFPEKSVLNGGYLLATDQVYARR